MLFHERLKHLRNLCFYMQKEIAAMLGVSTRTFQGWETGRSEPSIEKIIMIAKLFEVSADYLFGLSDDPNPSKGVAEPQLNPQSCPTEQ